MQHYPNILIHQLNFSLLNGRVLFKDLDLSFSAQKTGLIGRNGTGKSTLLKLITKQLFPTSGAIQVPGSVIYVAQNPEITPDMTVAGLLGFEDKLKALDRIMKGSVDETDFALLNEDWEVEARFQQQLKRFGLAGMSGEYPLVQLSSGQLTRLCLTRAFSSEADFLLLDEPTNHLDQVARGQCYEEIRQWKKGMIVISHDRTLLNLMEEIVELTSLGVQRYGGNYEAYQTQKSLETQSREQQFLEAKKQLQKTQQSVQSSKEKHEQRQAQGRKLRKTNSQAKVILDKAKDRSSRSQGELLTRHHRMITEAQTRLKTAIENRELVEGIRVDLPKTQVANGKILLQIKELEFTCPNGEKPVLENFNLTLQGPEHIALTGPNGSGKSTLVKLILNELKPKRGEIYLGAEYVSYLDQTASLLKEDETLLENFIRLNPDANENDAYRCLALFLFRNVMAQKRVNTLSGGEKLRALLACVLMAKHPPQLLILDEPTNHLDVHSIEQIESALKNYRGAMIIISHDAAFLENVGIDRFI